MTSREERAALVKRLREQSAHVKDNANRLKAFEGSADEARCRELAACYLDEIALTIEMEEKLDALTAHGSDGEPVADMTDSAEKLLREFVEVTANGSTSGLHDMATLEGRAEWYAKVAEIRVRAQLHLATPAQPAEVNGGWLPIESAPKIEAEHILLTDGDWIGIGWWNHRAGHFEGDNLDYDGCPGEANHPLATHPRRANDRRQRDGWEGIK